MKKLLILLLGLIALALLGYLCIYKKHGPAIQNDIQVRTTAALTDAGLEWAEVTADGRNIILTGKAADQSAKDKAGEIAKIYGYHLIDNQIETADSAATTPASGLTDPYVMSAIKGKDGKVTLSGYMPDEATRSDIIIMAKDNFGEDNIIDELKIMPGAADYWVPGVKAGLSQLEFLEYGQAQWRNANLAITGLAASDQVKQSMNAQMAQILPDSITAAVDLITPEMVVRSPETDEAPAQMSTEEKVAAISCQDQFAEMLSRNIIVFRTNSADISADSFDLLDQLSAVAKNCPLASVQIEGHTDSSGSSSYNQDLSQRRAQSVVDYLVNQGVNNERFSAIGFGEDAPIADNNTEEGRSLNRRIEFTVKGL